MVDYPEIGEWDVNEEIPDYYNFSHEDIKEMFDLYNEYPVKVPSDVLHYQSAVKEAVMKKAIEPLGLPDPYRVRAQCPKSLFSFLNQMKLACTHHFFDSNLCFPLDTD